MRKRARCSSIAAIREKWCRYWRRRQWEVSFSRGSDRVLWGRCSRDRSVKVFDVTSASAVSSFTEHEWARRRGLRVERRWCGSRSRAESLGRLWRVQGRTAKWFCSMRRWERGGGVRNSRMRWCGGLRRGTVFMICSSVAVGRSWAWPRWIRRFICWIFAFKCAVVRCLLETVCHEWGVERCVWCEVVAFKSLLWNLLFHVPFIWFMEFGAGDLILMFWWEASNVGVFICTCF